MPVSGQMKPLVAQRFAPLKQHILHGRRSLSLEFDGQIGLILRGKGGHGLLFFGEGELVVTHHPSQHLAGLAECPFWLETSQTGRRKKGLHESRSLSGKDEHQSSSSLQGPAQSLQGRAHGSLVPIPIGFLPFQ